MSLFSQDDIYFILKLLDESEFDELHVEFGDFKLLAKKQKKGEQERAISKNKEEFSPPIESIKSEIKKEKIAAQEPIESKLEPESTGKFSSSILIDNELIPIRAPMLGTFYRTPKPGAPPFVEIGSYVTEEDPVCVIEVMKCFNTVRAGVQGEIVQICAEHGQMVEFQQPLFLVKKKSDKKNSTKI